MLYPGFIEDITSSVLAPFRGTFNETINFQTQTTGTLGPDNMLPAKPFNKSNGDLFQEGEDKNRIMGRGKSGRKSG